MEYVGLQVSESVQVCKSVSESVRVCKCAALSLEAQDNIKLNIVYVVRKCIDILLFMWRPGTYSQNLEFLQSKSF